MVIGIDVVILAIVAVAVPLGLWFLLMRFSLFTNQEVCHCTMAAMFSSATMLLVYIGMAKILDLIVMGV